MNVFPCIIVRGDFMVHYAGFRAQANLYFISPDYLASMYYMICNS